MPTVVVAHQPNFLPWLGYFYKMSYSDLFILLDDVEWTKNSYINRCRIPMKGKATWLTVPASPPRSDCMIREVRIADAKFARKHIGTIRQIYGKTPFFDEVFALLEQHYGNAGESLADFNISLLMTLAAYLDMPCRFIRQSELGTAGRNNELLAQSVKAVGGDLYVSGAGASKYITGEEHIYADHGVGLAYQIFRPPAYSQGDGPAVPGCSIIDLLFHHGKSGRDFLVAQADPPYERWRPSPTP